MQSRAPQKAPERRPRNVINVGGARYPPHTGHAAVARRATERLEGKEFGEVVSVNNGFGFIQPYGEKEQAYYNHRDAPGSLEVGMEIAFTLSKGAKGLSASSLQLIPADAIVSESSVKGLIVTAAEGNRCRVGQIELPLVASTVDRPKYAIYLDESSRKAAGESPIGTLLPGDEVEFTLNTIMGTSYARASQISIVRTRKERRRQEKIAALVASGQEMEEGIIDGINKSGEFGFIKCADRTGQLYFKLSDVMTTDRIEEGLEIKFFVMEEPAGPGNKLRSRAVHISSVPRGSVKFEETLQSNATGVVIKDPVFYPKEIPGMIRVIRDVVEGDGGMVASAKVAMVDRVELWPRCMPEGLVLRVGDSISFDMIKYRPEKLVFARSVKVLSFRKMGRESGTVVKLQRRGSDSKESSSGNFGFIKPDNRDHDVFFRITDVIGPSGAILSDSEVHVGLRLSFDVIADDGSRASNGGSGTAGRTRAVRACVESFQGCSLLLSHARSETTLSLKTTPVKQGQPKDQSPLKTSSDARNHHIASVEGADKCLLKSDITGVIVKLPKRDSHGIIRILTDIGNLAEVDFSDVLNKEVVDALVEFVSLPEWTDVMVEHVGPRLRKTLHTLIQKKFPGIAHETVPNPGENGSAQSSSNTSSKSIRLWKLPPTEFEKWDSDRVKKEKSELTNRLFKLMTNSGVVPVAATELQNGLLPTAESDSAPRLYYAAYKNTDLLPTKWNVDKDLTVKFDLCLDPARNCLVASQISLTDEAIEDHNVPDQWRFGRIESVKHMKGGWIRCFPTDEKLKWEIPSVLSISSLTSAEEPSEAIAPAEEQDDLVIAEPERTELKSSSFNAVSIWNHAASLLTPDTLVAFQIRRKGGMRVAMGLHAVPSKNSNGKSTAIEDIADSKVPEKIQKIIAGPLPDSFYTNVFKKTETLYGEVLAVVVENKQAVLLDVSNCPLLCHKYYDINDPTFKLWLGKYLLSGGAKAAGADADQWHKPDRKQDSSKTDLLDVEADVLVGEDDNTSDVDSTEDNKPRGILISSRTEDSLDASIVYFSRLPNNPIPFFIDAKLGVNTSVSVGDLVICNVVVNWALQRTPLHINILRKYDFQAPLSPFSIMNQSIPEVIPLANLIDSSTDRLTIRRCGTVRRLINAATYIDSVEGKRGLRNKSSTSRNVELWAEVVCEMEGQSLGDSATVPSPCVFLIDLRGIPKAAAKSEGRESSSSAAAAATDGKITLNTISEGDLVDFIPVALDYKPSYNTTSENEQCKQNSTISSGAFYGLAVSVNIVRINKVVASKAALFPSSTATLKRSVINAELKDSKSGIKSISMAQGPPDDKSIGFPPGWRSTPDISSLPWGHLLQHLAPAAK